MTGWSWRGLRQRAASLAGAFVAMASGVALTTASGVVLGASSQPAADAAAAQVLSQAGALLVMLAVIGAFVTMFIVASTFAFSVAQRRRELARLRLVGATPGQVARLIRVEVLTVAIAAGLVGAFLGIPAVSALIWLLSIFKVVPHGLHLTTTVADLAAPAGIAAGIACVVAVSGAAAAARRAALIAPAEALREASVDRRIMTPGRWVTGLIATAVGVGMLLLVPLAPPDGQLPLALFVPLPLVVACAMLAPVVIVPVTSLITAPATRLSTASGLLARQNLKTAVRRTASTCAPILVLIGVAGSLLAATSVLAEANRQNTRLLYTSDLITTPTWPVDIDQLRSLPGVAAASRIWTTQVDADVNRTTRTLTTLGVDPAGVTAVLGLGRVDGDLSALTSTTVAMTRSAAARYRLRLGDTLRLRLPDSSRTSLRLVAVFDGPPLSAPLLVAYQLTAAHPAPLDRSPAGHVTETIHVKLAPRASPADITARLTPVGPTVSTQHYLATLSDTRAEGMRIGALVLAVFAMAYTLLAVANTTVMSFADRHRELVRLRVVGARPAQLVGMISAEALAIAVTGIAFGAAVIAVSTGGLWTVLRGIGLIIPLALPWGQLVAIAATAVAIVLTASAAPAIVQLRRRFRATDLTA